MSLSYSSFLDYIFPIMLFSLYTPVPFGNYGNELKNIQYTKKQTMQSWAHRSYILSERSKAMSDL